MIDDKKTIFVHRTPPDAMRAVHRSYGLMILTGSVKLASQPDSYYNCPERYFEHYSVSHLIDGHGMCSVGGGPEIELSPGSAVIITPGCINRYGGYGGKRYVEDCISFFGPVADMLKDTGVIKDGVFQLGSTRRILPILQLQRDPAYAAQIKANIELQKFLVDIYLESLNPLSDCPVFQKLLSEIKTCLSKWWTVTEMAEYCGVSDDQLRRIFLKYTNCTPKFYIDQLKLKHAAELLISTSMSVARIAVALGYLDQYHFSRRFKQVMGLSPLQYRNNGPNGGRVILG